MRAEMTAWRTRLDTIRERVEQTILFRIWERLLENEFLDRGVALGAKAFVSLFPSVIVVAGFHPFVGSGFDHHDVDASARIERRRIDDGQGGVRESGDTKRATGVVGLLFTFFYISSFTTALRRVYTRAWRRPSGRFASGYAGGAGFLVGLAAYSR